MGKLRLVAAEIETNYGIWLISPRPPVRPAKMDPNGSEERRYGWRGSARHGCEAKVLAA
jgi:hypothetical protein